MHMSVEGKGVEVKINFKHLLIQPAKPTNEKSSFRERDLLIFHLIFCYIYSTHSMFKHFRRFLPNRVVMIHLIWSTVRISQFNDGAWSKWLAGLWEECVYGLKVLECVVYWRWLFANQCSVSDVNYNRRPILHDVPLRFLSCHFDPVFIWSVGLAWVTEDAFTYTNTYVHTHILFSHFTIHCLKLLFFECLLFVCWTKQI